MYLLRYLKMIVLLTLFLIWILLSLSNFAFDNKFPVIPYEEVSEFQLGKQVTSIEFFLFQILMISSLL